jgi:FkbM family methyltransferase
MTTTYRLPNGLTVDGLGALDTGLVYRDIFEDGGYARYGVTIRDGDCIFDVGANTGLFLVYLNQTCSRARVYAFEPVGPIFRVLRRNAARCGRLAVSLFNVGLSRAPGQARFSYYPRLSCASTMYPAVSPEQVQQEHRDILGQFDKLPRPLARLWALLPERARNAVAQWLRSHLLWKRSEVCELRSLSEVFRTEAIDRVDLLKVDVEGSEHDVLAGIAEDDWPRIRQAVVEVHDGPAATDAVVALLRGHGFQVTVQPHATIERIVLIYAVRPGN